MSVFFETTFIFNIGAFCQDSENFTSESRPTAGESRHFHAREYHFREPFTGINIIRVFIRRNMVYHEIGHF